MNDIQQAPAFTTRLNFATSTEILDDILARMVRAVRGNAHA
jgi:bifunctional pyridoxal-dependent enzyme with beta-cystathionase and maltose regulon repressor activities